MRDLTKSNKAVVKKRERNTYKGVEVLGVFGESIFDG